MLTKPSKWLLYVASYQWVYLLQIASLTICDIDNLHEITLSSILNAISKNRFVIILLVTLFILSVAILRMFRTRLRNNTRIKYHIGPDTISEMAWSLIAYIATVLTITLDAYGLLLTFAIFIAGGIVITSTDKLHFLPIFWLRKYHVFRTDSGAIIMTKLSSEEYRIKMDNSPDGIMARELVKNTYIIL